LFVEDQKTMLKGGRKVSPEREGKGVPVQGIIPGQG